MPKWMQELHAVCLAQSTAVNVKLFLIKLIVNIPETFEPYAKHISPFYLFMIIIFEH